MTRGDVSLIGEPIEGTELLLKLIWASQLQVHDRTRSLLRSRNIQLQWEPMNCVATQLLPNHIDLCGMYAQI
jgi:hypothetical protein